MLRQTIYNLSGKESGTIDLPEDIFKNKIQPDLIHQAVTTQLSNARRPIAHTKTRGEVSGSGRKPWRQKGTGRARAGDIRMPQWVGGGVVFGPRKERNYYKRLPKKMRRKAIFMALTDKLIQKKIIILDKLSLSKISTKEAEKVLHKLPIGEGSILLIISKTDPAVELSFRNLPYLKILLANCLNVYDILRYDWLILDQKAIEEIKKIYSEKSHLSKISTQDSKKPKNKEKKKILSPKRQDSQKDQN